MSHTCTFKLSTVYLLQDNDDTAHVETEEIKASHFTGYRHKTRS